MTDLEDELPDYKPEETTKRSARRHHWRQLERAINKAQYHAHRLGKDNLAEHFKTDRAQAKRMQRRKFDDG